MKGIDLINISKSFGDKKVLENISLTFPQGSRTCIMGDSGRGKTTLLHLILGLLTPDEGVIEGVPNKKSVVFQEDRLCEQFSALSNVLAVTCNTKSKEELCACFDLLGLKGEENTPVSDLSGGMRRRVAIARALMHESRLIILDEPFKGLDDVTHEKTASTVLSYTEDKTLIIATHDARDASLLNAKIIDLNTL